MTEETVGADSQFAGPVDGPTDDYEYWRGELPETHREGEAVLYVPDLWDSRVDYVSCPV